MLHFRVYVRRTCVAVGADRHLVKREVRGGVCGHVNPCEPRVPRVPLVGFAPAEAA